jgi:hypothetical protein
VAGPPAPRFIARRSQRRAQVRRRRALLLGCVVAACAAVVAIIATSGSSTAPHAGATAGSSSAKSHATRGHSQQRSGPSAHTQRVEAAGVAEVRRLAKLGLPVYCAGPHGTTGLGPTPTWRCAS